MSQTREERILEIADIINLSAESLALIENAQLDIDQDDLKVWWFKRYATIGSAFIVEYITQKNREKENQLEQDARQLETEAQQNPEAN